MALRLSYSRGARADLVEQHAHLALERPATAERFLQAVDAAVAGLAEMPGKGAQLMHPSSTIVGLRRWSVTGFPNHLILYREWNGVLEVVRVVHGARNLVELLANDEPEFDPQF